MVREANSENVKYVTQKCQPISVKVKYFIEFYRI